MVAVKSILVNISIFEDRGTVDELTLHRVFRSRYCHQSRIFVSFAHIHHLCSSIILVVLILFYLHRATPEVA